MDSQEMKAESSVALKEHKITVLLIDDQPIVGESVRRMLADEPDIDFHFCQEPSGAIQKAVDISATVILQDLVMPEIDGLTLVRFFRANEKTREIPLIVLSTKEEPATKAEAFALGANDYLVKLPDRLEIIARIRYHSRGYIAHLQRNEAYQALLESQEALANELNQAAEYVRSLLPAPLSGEIKTRWAFIPSTSLGGDSFGYHWIDEDHLAIYLLDVCGHGVGAALLSISAINTLRSQSLPIGDFRDPGKVLAGLNEAYRMEDHNNMFFTIWYGVYNKKDRELVFSGGGHPPVIAVTGESPEGAEIRLLDSRGLAIGTMPDLEYETSRFKLMPFTKLYVYSDGTYEIEEPGGRMWGHDDFVGLIGGLPVTEDSTIEDIMREIKSAKQGDLFDDDVSLLEVVF